jgi:hypothetical protein
MSEKIDVTPNIKRCLEILRNAVKTLPEGDLKTQAEGALEYLESAARGETQPNEGVHCQPGKFLIPVP